MAKKTGVPTWDETTPIAEAKVSTPSWDETTPINEVKKKDQPSPIDQQPSIDTSSSASGQSGVSSGQTGSVISQIAQKQKAELTPGTPEYNYRQSVIAKDKSILEAQKAGKQTVPATIAKPTFYEKEIPEVKTESTGVTQPVAPESIEEVQYQQDLSEKHQEFSEKKSEELLTNILGDPNTKNRIPGVYEPNFSKEEVDKIQGDNIFRMSHQEQEKIVERMVESGISEEFARQKLALKIDGHIQKSADELKEDLIFQKEQFLNLVNGKPKTPFEIQERRKEAIRLETQDIMDYGYAKLDKEYQELIPVSKEYWLLIEKAKTAKPEEKFEINKKLYLLNEKLKAGREGKKNLTDPITGTNGTEESKVYTEAVNNYKQRYSGTSRDKMIQMYQEKAHEIKYLERYINKYKNEDPFKGPSQDDAKSQLRNKKAEFEALSEIMLLNEDPASLERGVFKGLLTSAGKSLAESVGVDVTSNTEIAQRFGESMNKAGLPLTEEQQQRIKSTSAENVGEVLGELPSTAVKFIIANKALGAVKGIEAISKFAKGVEAGLGGGKLAKLSAGLIESTLTQGTQGAIVRNVLGDENIGAAMMGAEGFAEKLFESIIPINNKWAKIASQMVVGGIGSITGEYLGDYVDNIVSDYKYHGLDTDRASEKTFGGTPEEIGDKFLTIATVSFLFPGIKGSMEAYSNAVVAKNYFEQTGDRKRLEELDSFAKKNGIDLDKAEEAIKQKAGKPTENDKENQQGVPSEVQGGQEPIAAEPIQAAGGETTEAGGDVQAQGKEEVKPTVESTSKALELEDKSDNELIQLYEKLSSNKSKDSGVLANMVENIQEKREKFSILNSPLEKISDVIDGILKKEEYFLEKREAREAKEVAEKYRGEVSSREAMKDFKEAFFGNPDTWVSDALKMKESVRAYTEKGGTFKDLLISVQKEFESDSFTEEEAASVIKNKLDSLAKKDFRQQQIAEAYQEAKENGTNPELVEAVESLLSAPEQVAADSGVTQEAEMQQEPTPAVSPKETTLKTAAGKLRDAAGKIRKSNISADLTKKLEEKLGVKLSAEGIEGAAKNDMFSSMMDGLSEIVAKGLDTSADMVETIDKAIEHVRNSDWYKGISEDKRKDVEDLIAEDVKEKHQALKDEIEAEKKAAEPVKEEPKVSEEPKAGKEKTRESRGFKRVRLNELDPEIKAKLEGVANYKVQDNKEFNDKIIDFVNEVTPEVALEYAMDMTANLEDGSAIKKKLILYNAASIMKTKASEKLKKAKKDGDLASQSEAEAELALSYNAILTASKIGTAAGQLNAIDAELHKKYPSLYMIIAMNEIAKNGKEVLSDDTKFKDESGKKITIEEGIEKGRTKTEDDLRKKIEKEFNSKIDELNKKIESLKSEPSITNKKKEREETKAKLRKRNSQIWTEFKKAGISGGAQATFIPFTTKQIELISEFIANEIKIGALTTSQIINEALTQVRKINGAVKKDHIHEIAKSVKEFNEKLSEEKNNKKEAGKEPVGEKQELTAKKLKEIALKHLFDRKGVPQTLAKTIIDETKMSVEEANAIADNISKSIIDPIIDEIVDRNLLNIVKPTETNTNLTDQEILNKKENKKAANKIKEAIKLGVLSNNEIFQAAFEDKFGFRTLDTRTKAKLNDIVEELTKVEAEVSKTVEIDGQEVELDTTQRERILGLQKEFNTILQSATPLNLAIILSEINSAIYLSILSSPTSTSFKAFVGSFSGAAFGVFSDSFTKGPLATISGMAATLKPSNISASFRRAQTALKTGLVEVGKTQQAGEFSSEKQSSIENYLFNGLSEAVRNKEKGKVVLKTLGIALKNIRILAAMDAFLVSQTGIYSETANRTIDKDTKVSQEKVFKDIAESEYKDIKSDIESSVDKDIREGLVGPKNREKEIARRLGIKTGSSSNPS